MYTGVFQLSTGELQTVKEGGKKDLQGLNADHCRQLSQGGRHVHTKMAGLSDA